MNKKVGIIIGSIALLGIGLGIGYYMPKNLEKTSTPTECPKCVCENLSCENNISTYEKMSLATNLSYLFEVEDKYIGDFFTVSENYRITSLLKAKQSSNLDTKIKTNIALYSLRNYLDASSEAYQNTISSGAKPGFSLELLNERYNKLFSGQPNLTSETFNMNNCPMFFYNKKANTIEYSYECGNNILSNELYIYFEDITSTSDNYIATIRLGLAVPNEDTTTYKLYSSYDKENFIQEIDNLSSYKITEANKEKFAKYLVQFNKEDLNFKSITKE